MKTQTLFALLSSVSATAASCAVNINYHSPSEHHPALGIEIQKEAIEASELFVTENVPLKWSELFYRGYMELKVRPDSVMTQYFGLPDLLTRNGLEISLVNFTVEHGANSISRPIAGETVQGGTAEGGELSDSRVAFDTETGEYLALEM